MLGFKHAINGALLLFKTERNFKIQFGFFVVVLVIGFVFKIKAIEWAVLLITSSLVLSLEAINSALEKLSDKLSPEKSDEIKWVKDVAAGAVLIASIISFAVGCILFYPYFSR